MALFKILKGNTINLPETYKTGWMYITEDTGDIYLDISDSYRIQLNANKANFIRGVKSDGSEGTYGYGEINGLLTKLNVQENTLNSLLNAHDKIQVSLEGDVTGIATINDSDLINIVATLADSGVTPNSYGQTVSTTVDHEGTIQIPYITVDAKGRVTSAKTSTVILPSVNNINNSINSLTNKHDAINIALSGDVTGSATIDANNKLAVTTELSNTGVIDGTYGPKDTDNLTPPFKTGTITVPQITIDEDGRITNAADKTIILPSVDNINDSINSLTNKHNAININISGDATGSATIASDNGLTVSNLTLENSGVTAGSYGLKAAATPAHEDSFEVPYITVDAKGRVTNATVNTVTLPSVDNINNSINSLTNKHDAINIVLSGDVTGSATIDANNKLAVTTDISASGVSPGTYGLEAAATPGHGESFIVPYVEINADGRITKAGEYAVTLPSVTDLQNQINALSSAMIFLGTSATTITDGGTEKPTINNATVIPVAGNVVLYGSQEYIWNGSVWELFGDEGSYALKTISISAGTGLTGGGDLSSNRTLSLAASGVTAGTYGAASTPSHGGTFAIPSLTIDTYGRVTKAGTVNVTLPAAPTLSGGSAAAADATVVGGVTVSGHAVTVDKKTLTAGSNITITGAADKITIAATNTDTKVTTAADTSTTKAYVTTCTGATTGTLKYHTSVYVNHSTGVLMGAAWNDYAEYRETRTEIEPGRVVCENGDDTLSLSITRLQPGANIVSDTFGFAIGETEQSKTPLAVSGRVLAYPYEDRHSYKPGDAVCAGPDGTVSKMSREEIMTYPECILGTVSAIPEYETWGEGNVPVNGRIWIKVR